MSMIRTCIYQRKVINEYLYESMYGRPTYFEKFYQDTEIPYIVTDANDGYEWYTLPVFQKEKYWHFTNMYPSSLGFTVTVDKWQPYKGY